MTTKIRDSTPEDAAAFNDIYNPYVLGSDCTMQLEPSTLAEREAYLRARIAAKHPVLVLEDEQRMLGWAALVPYSERAGYAETVENSVYLREDAQGRGHGRRLLTSLLERANEGPFHCIIARVATTQSASLALHARLGFVEEGRLREVGRKFDRYLDVAFLALRRNPSGRFL